MKPTRRKKLLYIEEIIVISKKSRGRTRRWDAFKVPEGFTDDVARRVSRFGGVTSACKARLVTLYYDTIPQGAHSL